MILILFVLLTLVGLVIVYRRPKNIKVRTCLVLGLMWIWIFCIWSQVAMMLLFFFPTLVGLAIVYRRTKNAQVRACLVLGLLWTCMNLYIDYVDTDAVFGRTQLGHFVTYPLFISAVIISPLDKILAGLPEILLLPPLMYGISFFIIFIVLLPLYLFSLIINRRSPLKKENGDHDQERKSI